MKKPALSELTLTEKISQLLMIAQGQLLMNHELDENRERVRRSYDEIDEIMEKCQYGSIWTGAGVVEANDHLAAKVASTMKHFPGVDMYEIRDDHGSAPKLIQVWG